MNRIYFLFLLLPIFCGGCLRSIDGLPPDPWEPVFNFTTDTPIRNLHASNVELQVITDTEFLRLDANRNIISQHTLPLPDEFYGRPSMSELVFVRTVRGALSNEEEIEFFPVRNPDGKVTKLLSEFEENSTEGLSLQNSSKSYGAFNLGGDRFCLPALSVTKSHYVFLIIAFEMNLSRTAFTNIELEHRIDATDLPASFLTIQNFKFVNGHYYAMSLDGVWRVSPNGTVKQVSNAWTVDAFQSQDTVYVTGGQNVNFFFSTDNGNTLERFNTPSALRYVEVENGYILHQGNPGFPFGLPQDGYRSIQNLRLNRDFDLTVGNFQAIEGFAGCTYMSLQKQLYFTCGPLELEEE